MNRAMSGEEFLSHLEVLSLGESGLDFYEDDQPVEEVIVAFERGEKHLTAPPMEGNL